MGIFETLSHVVPELMLAIGAMALLIAGVFMGEQSSRTISFASIALLVGTMLVVAVSAGEGGTLLFDGAFKVDAFSNFCKVIIFAGAAFAILMSDKFAGNEDIGRRDPIPRALYFGRF